ncbi:type II secretion system protein [Candidatus Saccharibacteria bacterium]|nr:type II secretion system protein [Candidatus Saccharibacteria bacterium]
MSERYNKKGFTIIEVVLVLAIAGLIFLMVFIALPALQRGQRNTQRKNDLSRIATAATQYQSNNSGRLPFNSGDAENCYTDAKCLRASSTFVKRYILANDGSDTTAFSDPDGEPYQIYISAFTDNGLKAGDTGKTAWGIGANASPPKNLSFETDDHTIYAYGHAKCSAEEGKMDYSSGSRDFVLSMLLEGNSWACVDNQ